MLVIVTANPKQIEVHCQVGEPDAGIEIVSGSITPHQSNNHPNPSCNPVSSALSPLFIRPKPSATCGQCHLNKIKKRNGQAWFAVLYLTKSFDSFNLFDMKSMTANEAKTRFGEFIDIAQREPVRVLRHDRVVGVMVSPNDYEKMREWYADRLIRTMDAVADHAASLGLTEAGIDDLLRDES
jgi:PHD/YefM family antitoxin component YafN of YafNO toxin-antitoxin module